MAKSHGLVGASCACLFFVGCTLDSFSLSALGTSKDGGPVVAGSLDVVTTSTQNALRDMGLFVSMNRDGETVRLTSTTPGGKRFALRLKGRKTDHGEETQVSIQWEKEADPSFWMQLTAALAAPNAAAAASEGPPR